MKHYSFCWLVLALLLGIPLPGFCQGMISPVPQGIGSSSSDQSLASFSRKAGEHLIAENTRVLHIGDSHTVGIYGDEMDALMRKTGAKVQTYGVAGSSPSWWWTKKITRCGFVGKTENGLVDRPADWRTPRQTPELRDLIRDFQPDMIVISLGANLISADSLTIEKQVDDLWKIATHHGSRIVWVGPPRSRETPEHAHSKNDSDNIPIPGGFL